MKLKSKPTMASMSYLLKFTSVLVRQYIMSLIKYKQYLNEELQ